MLDIRQENDMVIVNDAFCFTNTSTNLEQDFITCCLTCWEDVQYGEPNIRYIDYPGEYQQDNMVIICTMSKDNKLNYVIKSVKEKFAFVQDAKAANADAFEGVTDVIAYGENVSLQLQKLDLECEITDI